MSRGAARGDGKTAFVLSGGGSLGAIQVGMLQAIMEAGIRPDFMIGTSVGAVNAAWLAAQPDLQGTLKLAEMVGPKGKVYAVDIQPEMLAIIKNRMKAAKLTNIETVQNTETPNQTGVSMPGTRSAASPSAIPSGSR